MLLHYTPKVKNIHGLLTMCFHRLIEILMDPRLYVVTVCLSAIFSLSAISLHCLLC